MSLAVSDETAGGHRRVFVIVIVLVNALKARHYIRVTVFV